MKRVKYFAAAILIALVAFGRGEISTQLTEAVGPLNEGLARGCGKASRGSGDSKPNR